MATYTFNIDTVEVHNPKGNQPDSDWLTLVWTVNSQTFQKVHHLGGSIPAGTVLNGPWKTDLIEIADSDVVTFNYLITNRSYSGDDLKQGEQAVQDGAKVAEKIAPIAGGIVGLIFGGDPAGGAAIGKDIGNAIGTAVDALSSVFDTVSDLFTDANCDGEILHDTFVYAPGQIRQVVAQPPVSKEYAGSQAESRCGTPPHTRVVFSVKLIHTSVTSTPSKGVNALSVAVGATSLYRIKADGQVWTKYFPAPDKPGQWSDWLPMGPNVFPKDATVTALSTRPGATSLYVVGLDGQVWTKYFPAPDKPGQWSDWLSMGPNVFPKDAAVTALSTTPGATSLYLVGLDGQVWTKYFPAPDKPGQWSDWLPMGPNVFPKDATVTSLSTAPNATSLYVVGLDGQVWTKYFPAPDKPGQWSDWLPMGPNVFPQGGAVTALSTAPNATSLYVVGLDGQVWTKYFPAPDKPGQWSDWLPMGPNVFAKDATVTSLSTRPGATSLYLVGLDGQVWTKYFPAPDKAGQWSDWFSL